MLESPGLRQLCQRCGWSIFSRTPAALCGRCESEGGVLPRLVRSQARQERQAGRGNGTPVLAASVVNGRESRPTEQALRSDHLRSPNHVKAQVTKVGRGAQTAADWDKPSFHIKTCPDGPGVRLPSLASTRVQVDFIMPYGQAEVQYLPDSLRSAAWQQAADIHLHLVPDGGAKMVSTPHLPKHVTVHRYMRQDGKTDRLGPYRICNAIAAKHTRTQWLFVCDADDISLPTRAWESVATCERYHCEQVGGEMIQWLDAADKELESRMNRQPRWPSGLVYAVAPKGIVTNPTRCVSVAAFRRLNGFEAWLTSADFEFDNRSQLCGVKTYKASVVWGLRRLRRTSITTAPEMGFGSEIRARNHREIMRRLKLPDQSNFGAMHLDKDLLIEIGP